MKVSLISPLFNESSIFKSHLQDIKSFFARFPIEIELILVVPRSDQETLGDYQEEHTKEFQTKIVRTKSSERAKNILEGLKTSSGDIVLIFSWDLTVPLAEFFNFIQELIQNPDTQVVLGNRFDPKKKNHLLQSGWHRTLNSIVIEKLRKQGWALLDPLTPFVALRKIDQSKLASLKLKGWFYTPDILTWAHEQGLKIEEVSIGIRQTEARQKYSSVPLFREFLRHFF